jgi:hypothetical protein
MREIRDQMMARALPLHEGLVARQKKTASNVGCIL